ncbi:MAG: hypothetical protein A3B74_04090 [Candidatus Kerfeldbacteria bacterium RIFCSPHIGHO2_02_FULL_42_14]|uniref:Thymidylate kinase n=1 Tax=Candidatus Kerfeldbacteria bacterium RIFCSPHIGHO2_02_FULL_42_14 TaxID=1798540 RepID=A0A1G2AQX5_9BACT|nr:MAG: hypothetical protein A3B74_04090 [Candidatus Kerfeldbacteria bacterium RIFCSPHIGHO2_02_FULL_42_14]OGY80688.1 MAG: hypothetical protein A3E60_04585 [Candidatus Kerfeldbacteria bacterium RIFCSPHIGHO2_12_FULL_42_13]OGY82615.1 MAG: hypothetical protein A3I91_04250 [Candidatus Kerfeldbacteria bacterium RIFCSPLOWO2_02_FULL_42_19]OGY85218.1 MAG: hypothetical protein A3G01_01380 [Candidatus Kerfeldbacteria bacterium RIFCSPLOWO2_12_FULL_43_9]
MSRGKLIVLCGTDGAGKATQTKLLIENLRDAGIATETCDFPQYGKPSCYFVEQYLNGMYGSVEEVGPYRASLFYALDRYEKSFEMHRTLAAGKHIVSNRYVSANQAHQGSKISDADEREKFLAWLNELEYGILNIPKPDLTIILYVPPQLGQKLVEQKKENRSYLRGKTKDIHEEDLVHLGKTARVYLELAQQYDTWVTIQCTEGERLKTRREIAKEVWKHVQRIV